MTKISAIIVDDEPLARRRIRTLLGRERDIELLEECADGTSAVEAIRRHRPNLVFLDVQMPEMNGFAVLRALGPELTAAVVFVTAYEQFSLRAFDVHALDYLLKPFHRRRFQEALRRVRQRFNNERELADVRVRLAALLDAADGEASDGADAFRSGPIERLAVRTATKVAIVRVREIDWVQGDGNYVRLHVGSAVHLLRQTMKALVGQLDPTLFIRIHHSCIVNVERVRELQPWSHGDYVVILDSGKRLMSSRTYSNNLRRAFAL
jgi:two-component system LytT family response regulator